MNLLERLNRFTPKMCRLVARKKSGWHAMTAADIAKKSGLSKSRVSEISLLDSWETIPVGTVIKFSKACGVDVLNPWESMLYLRRQKMTHVVNASTGQRRLFSKIMEFKSEPKTLRSHD